MPYRWHATKSGMVKYFSKNSYRFNESLDMGQYIYLESMLLMYILYSDKEILFAIWEDGFD